MKYALLMLLFLAGCGPSREPFLRTGDLVLGSIPAVQDPNVPQKWTTVSSPGLILEVGTNCSGWSYFVAYEGKNTWISECELRRVGRLDWTKLWQFADEPPVEKK